MVYPNSLEMEALKTALGIDSVKAGKICGNCDSRLFNPPR